MSVILAQPQARRVVKAKRGYKRPKSSLPMEVAYTGAIHPASAKHQLTTLKKFGSYSVAVTSNGVGAISQGAVLSPATINDWGNLQNDWSEYRILAVEVEYQPTFEGALNGTLGGSIGMVIDRTSTTGGLASFQQLLEYEGMKVRPINKSFKISAKARGSNELAWTNITTNTFWCSYRMNATVVDVNHNYGNVIVSILVELRSAL